MSRRKKIRIEDNVKRVISLMPCVFQIKSKKKRINISGI